ISLNEHIQGACVFAFNNTTSHIAFAKDALVVLKINLGPEGAPKGIEWVFDKKDCEEIRWY
ncbi:20973_t:CDS:2, partial [Gigaspora margarita]